MVYKHEPPTEGGSERTAVYNMPFGVGAICLVFENFLPMGSMIDWLSQRIARSVVDTLLCFRVAAPDSQSVMAPAARRVAAHRYGSGSAVGRGHPRKPTFSKRFPNTSSESLPSHFSITVA